MSYVFRSSGYIRDRSALHCRCIASCRLRVDTRWTLRVNVNVVSLCLSSWLHVVYRSRFCETINSEFRRDVLLHERWTFVRKFYQFGNTVQRVSREGWHERRWFYMESRVEKSSSLNGRILIFENTFFERGCEKYIRFFFWKCHVSRWTRQGFYFQDNRVCNRIFIFFRRILIGILRALFRFEEDLYKIKNKNIYIYIWERNYLYFVVEKSLRKIVYWNGYIDRTCANIFGWNYERVGYIYSNS